MNIKKISTATLASVLLLTSNLSFASENGVERIKKVNESNVTPEELQVQKEKLTNKEEKESKKLIKEASSKERATNPDFQIGETRTLTIDSIRSYSANVTTTSNGLLCLSATLPKEYKTGNEYISFSIYDQNGDMVDMSTMYAKKWKGQSKTQYNVGLKPGKYEVTVYNGYDDKITTDVALSFRAIENVEFESNNSKEKSTPISLGKTYNGSLDNATSDIFKITVSQDTRVKVTLKDVRNINKEDDLFTAIDLANGKTEFITRHYENMYKKDLILKKGTNYITIYNDSALTDYAINVSTISGPLMPELDRVGDSYEYVSGDVEKGMRVYVKVGSKAYTQARVNDNGFFSLKTGKLKKGTIVQAYAVNSKGVKSTVAMTKCVDTTRPATPVINKFLVGHTKVTGNTEANIEVVCRIGGEKGIVYISKSDSKGKYSFTVGKLARGTKIEVQSEDAAENLSPIASRRAENYVQGPTASNLSNLSTTVTGKSVSGYTAYAKIGTKYYASKVATNGTFTIKIPKQKAYTKVYIFVKHPNGDTSYTLTKTVGSAPATPTIDKVTTKSTKVTGKSSKNCSITMTVGKKTYTGKTNSKGVYSIKIPKQKKGTKITVKAKNSAGFYSLAKSVKVK